MEIFTKLGFFRSDFRGTIPGNQLISGYCYPEINWFLSNNTRINLFPGIVTRKSIDFRVTIPGHFLRKQLLWIFLEIWAKINKLSQKYLAHFQVSWPGNQLISGNHDPEINLYPGNNTRKSINFRVSWPGSEISWKKFENFNL